MPTTLEEARLAGRAPPAGWTPPRPDRLRDALRTARVLGGVLVEMARNVDGDTTSTAGLARVREACRRRARQLGIEVDVDGAERVPAAGGLVFMWNQTSHLDHLVIPLAMPRAFFSTYNNEVRRFPIYGKRLARGEHVWLDRTDETQWRTAIEAAADRIRAGACALISPEGTRSWDGRLLPMKRGAFLLARRSGRPIVCLTVRGARELLPRGRLAVRPGRVDLEFSAPITDEPLEDAVVATFERTLGLPQR
jgi:1-acyl-sn-glycerol-3-phosphate acyltransferase